MSTKGTSKKSVRRTPSIAALARTRRAPGIAALARALMRASVPVIPNSPCFRRAETILGKKLTAEERAKFRDAWNSEVERYFREVDEL